MQPNVPGAQIISDIGNLTESQLLLASQGSQQPERSNFYYVKAIEAFMAFENNTAKPVRCRVELCYVPNLNARTGQAVDNLQTALETFHSGVNLKHAGMFRKYMRIQGTESAKSPTYRLLAAREFVLPAAVQYSTPAPPGQGAGVSGFPNQRRKYVTLRKYYKRPHKLIWKSYVQQQEITGPQLCDNGNFVLQWCSDTDTLVTAGEIIQSTGVRMWGTCGCKYFIKAGKLDNPSVLA